MVAVFIFTGKMDYDVKTQLADLAAHDFGREGGVATGILGNADRMEPTVNAGVLCQGQNPGVTAALPTPAWHQLKGKGKLITIK